MSWFQDGERGFAMSVRQTAIPVGGLGGARDSLDHGRLWFSQCVSFHIHDFRAGNSVHLALARRNRKVSGDYGSEEPVGVPADAGGGVESRAGGGFAYGTTDGGSIICARLSDRSATSEHGAR